MTGKELIANVLLMLHDNGRGLRTSSRHYNEESIAVQLSVQQVVTAGQLMLAPRPAFITLSRLVALAPANGDSTGIEVPDDFWKLICGTTDEDKYIQPEEPHIGEAFATLFGNRIWARGGYFFGSADTAVYYRRPPRIVNSGATLSTFPDMFYTAIKYATCRDMLAQEGREAVDRMKKFDAEYLSTVSELR
jgi:hypothetical protein